jgi:hypothetical protein
MDARGELSPARVLELRQQIEAAIADGEADLVQDWVSTTTLKAGPSRPSTIHVIGF